MNDVPNIDFSFQTEQLTCLRQEPYFTSAAFMCKKISKDTERKSGSQDPAPKQVQFTQNCEAGESQILTFLLKKTLKGTPNKNIPGQESYGKAG